MSRAAPQSPVTDGAAFTVGVAAASYNGALVDGLLERVTAALTEAGVKERRLTVARVPGSNELPVAAQWLAKDGKVDVVIALGVLIRGDTIHYELIAEASAQALQRVALDTGVAVINGVVVTENFAQAKARCTGRIDRGAEFAHAALAMAALKKRISP